MDIGNTGNLLRLTNRHLICLSLGTLLLLSSTMVLGEEKPRTIKVIGTGKACCTPILHNWFTVEPSTDPIIIPTRVYGEFSPEVIRRYMRIYFPRNYEALLEYEMFFLAQIDIAFFSGEQQKWLYDALTDHQKGGVNTRSIMSTHEWFHVPWRDSFLSDAFPNDVAAVIADPKKKEGWPGPIVINDGENLPGIMKHYKKFVEPLYPNYGGIYTMPKPGSVILSYTKNNRGLGYPEPGKIAHVFYWKWNKSITFTFMDMVGSAFWWGGGSHANPYALDIIANVIWFSTGRTLPDDVMQVHELRRLFFNFKIQKNLLLSLLHFSEKFDANPSGEYAELDGIEDIHQEGKILYLEMDFDASYDTMGTALQELQILEGKATKLKDKALFWIYLIEWMVTTGIFLFSGFVLWSLMVRRSLYQEVKTTKWGR